MALKDVSKIDDRLAQMYENQTTVAVETEQKPFVDRSETLLAQMNFIAINNKSFINYRK